MFDKISKELLGLALIASLNSCEWGERGSAPLATQFTPAGIYEGIPIDSTKHLPKHRFKSNSDSTYVNKTGVPPFGIITGVEFIDMYTGKKVELDTTQMKQYQFVCLDSSK